MCAYPSGFFCVLCFVRCGGGGQRGPEGVTLVVFGYAAHLTRHNALPVTQLMVVTLQQGQLMALFSVCPGVPLSHSVATPTMAMTPAPSGMNPKELPPQCEKTAMPGFTQKGGGNHSASDIFNFFYK